MIPEAGFGTMSVRRTVLQAPPRSTSADAWLQELVVGLGITPAMGRRLTLLRIFHLPYVQLPLPGEPPTHSLPTSTETGFFPDL
jgi:hypothetical protein